MKNKIQETKVAKRNKVVLTTDQLQLQESNKEILLNSIRQDFIAQSGTLSVITRTIAGVVLGTIWAICYKGNVVIIPNIWLFISIIIATLFFVVELFHYTIDSWFYHKKSDQIVEGYENTDIKRIFKDTQQHSKCSFRFLMIKSLIAFSLSMAFIIGICCLYQKSSTEKRSNTYNLQQIDSKVSKMPQKQVNPCMPK